MTKCRNQRKLVEPHQISYNTITQWYIQTSMVISCPNSRTKLYKNAQILGISLHFAQVNPVLRCPKEPSAHSQRWPVFKFNTFQGIFKVFKDWKSFSSFFIFKFIKHLWKYFLRFSTFKKPFKKFRNIENWGWNINWLFYIFSKVGCAVGLWYYWFYIGLEFGFGGCINVLQYFPFIITSITANTLPPMLPQM